MYCKSAALTNRKPADQIFAVSHWNRFFTAMHQIYCQTSLSDVRRHLLSVVGIGFYSNASDLLSGVRSVSGDAPRP